MKTIQSKLLLIFGAFLLLGGINLGLVLTSDQEEAGRIINLSGKQRMLSQRLAKAALELVRDPTSLSALKQVDDTAALFAKIQNGLLDGSSELGLPRIAAGDIRTQVEKNSELWAKFETQIGVIIASREAAITAADAAHQIRVLNTKLLSSAASAVSLLRRPGVFTDAATASPIIDMAGRQRMLTQRVAKSALASYDDPSDTASSNEFLAASQLFEKSLNTLIDGGADDMAGGGAMIQACTDSQSREQLLNTRQLWKEFRGHLETVRDFTPQRKLNFQAANQIAALSVPLLSNLNTATTMFDERSAAEASVLRVSNIAVVLIMLLTIGLGWTLVVRPLVKTLSNVIDGVARGADEIAGVAGQVLQASQELAQSSTEQAANVQEVSASMEEMSAMTRQNAEHAVSANSTVEESRQSVTSGGEHVRSMAVAMGNINQASEEIGQILTTIQDIAFQTNLLAVNAAIEAAGAGEAGSRFAMVADEVRNLSRRSASAAKESEQLIKAAIDRVQQGGMLVRELQESFTSVQRGSGKVASLVAEIRAASSEQARGVDEVNRTVMGLDSIAQRNSSFSEQTSSAASELDAQCTSLNDSVLGLVSLIRTENMPASAPSKPQAPRSSNKPKGKRRPKSAANKGKGNARQEPETASVGAAQTSDADGFVRF